MIIRQRQPKGTPWGGQFARSTHDDDNDLTFSSPDEELTRGATDPTLASDLIRRVRAGRYDPNKPLHRFAADGSIESLDYAQLGAEAATHRAEIQQRGRGHQRGVGRRQARQDRRYSARAAKRSRGLHGP